LAVETESGDLTAAFGGDCPGLGEITVDLTSGNCDLDLDRRFERLERVEVEQTSGNATLALRGEYPALERVTVESTSGMVDLDLRGQWPAVDVGVRIQATSGYVTVRVPVVAGMNLDAWAHAWIVTAAVFSQRDGR